MALTDPKQTLAYHQARVLTSYRDMRDMPLATVVKQAIKFFNTDTKPQTVPESEALWFYGLNHGMALIQSRRDPLEPLDAWELAFVSTYHEKMGEKAIRAFYYLLMICTRESRHNKSLNTDMKKIVDKFGQPMGDFLKSISGGEAGIHKALLDKPPATTLGTYVECLRWQFYHSSWSGGYGGKAWGAVTDCLARFVLGEFTAEMMLDTVWTLSHNNGPIFNKGLCYAMYGHSLIRILDVQRSGQIPEAVLHDAVISGYAEADLKQLMSQVAARYEEIGKYVDWFVVEALGAVKTYPTDKKAQSAKYGLSPKATEAVKQAAAAEKVALEKAAAAAAKEAKEWFQIMPNVKVKKIQRALAA